LHVPGLHVPASPDLHSMGGDYSFRSPFRPAMKRGQPTYSDDRIQIELRFDLGLSRYHCTCLPENGGGPSTFRQLPLNHDLSKSDAFQTRNVRRDNRVRLSEP